MSCLSFFHLFSDFLLKNRANFDTFSLIFEFQPPLLIRFSDTEIPIAPQIKSPPTQKPPSPKSPPAQKPPIQKPPKQMPPAQKHPCPKASQPKSPPVQKPPTKKALLYNTNWANLFWSHNQRNANLRASYAHI